MLVNFKYQCCLRGSAKWPEDKADEELRYVHYLTEMFSMVSYKKIKSQKL